MESHEQSGATDPLIGRIVGDKFRLQRCVGAGASGSVYQADQMSLGRTVAIKVLRSDLASDDRLVRRFHDEALAASRLNHPNTVSVLDYGQTNDGLLYIVMEFLRGETLTDLMRSSHPIDAPRIADLMSQVLSGLEEAHAAGVIHADLKADNVVVEHRRGGWDLAKVVDFGISRLLGAPRDAGDKTVSGTPEYMAPEVIGGADPTVRSDMYSAGILLYELLVGETPFTAQTSIEVLTRQIKEMPVPPSQRVSGREVNRALEAAALRALQKKPGDRFESAEQFRAAVNAALKPDASEEQILCKGCGVEVPASFRFCPECGHARGKPRSETRQFSPHHAHAHAPTQSAIGVAETLHHHEIPETTGAALIEDMDAVAEFDKPPPTAEHTSRGIFPLPLIGRDMELEGLRRFLMNEEAPPVLHLVGAHGSGRSRLLREACGEAADQGVAIYLATADPSGLASPYYPVKALVATVLGLPPICSYDALGDAIEAIGVTRRDLPGIAELFGHESELWQLEPQVRRRELLASTVRVLRAACSHGPTVLAFEDAHKYDAPSQELVRRLVESASDSDVMRVVITSTLEFADRWQSGERVVLEALLEPALVEIAGHVAHVDNEEMPTAEDLMRLTDASPHHVAQLVRYVIEGGSVETAPTALADVISARLELLPHNALQVLQVAAALGIECTAEQISAVLPFDAPKIEAALGILDARALAVLDGEVVWFPQDIVRDVVYESTPADVRRELHSSIGAMLRPLVSDAALLGHHAERAGELEAAAELLSHAGDASVHMLDDIGACEQYNRSLSCARRLMLASDESGPRTLFVETSVKLAEALRVAGEVGLARGIVEEARDHCRGTPGLEAQLLQASGHLFLTEGEIDDAVAMIRDAIGLAITSGRTALLSELYLDLSSMYLRIGDADQAIAEIEEGINLVTLGEGPAAEAGPSNMWHLLLRLSHLHRSLNNHNQAVRMAEAALAQAQRVRSGVGTARARALLAELFETIGDFESAADHRESAVEEMRRLGDRRGTAELLLAGSAATSTLMRIQPGAVTEARELAHEIGWHEGVRRAEKAT